MSDFKSDSIGSLPIRSRVAFVLAIAERVVKSINDSAFVVARRAIDDAWRWEEGMDVTAKHLYESNVEGLAVEGSMIENEAGSNSMCAVTAAFFYTLWHAFQQDLATGRIDEGMVPNDIAEVGEDVIDEVCDFAKRTGSCDEVCLNSIATRLCGELDVGRPEELGQVIPQKDFTYTT